MRRLKVSRVPHHLKVSTIIPYYCRFRSSQHCTKPVLLPCTFAPRLGFDCFLSAHFWAIPSECAIVLHNGFLPPPVASSRTCHTTDVDRLLNCGRSRRPHQKAAASCRLQVTSLLPLDEKLTAAERRVSNCAPQALSSGRVDALKPYTLMATLSRLCELVLVRHTADRCSKPCVRHRETQASLSPC